jgi:hypothetical protein
VLAIGPLSLDRSVLFQITLIQIQVATCGLIAAATTIV